MKRVIATVVLVAGGLSLAGCQPADNPNAGGQPSSVGNGQTRNNGPFAPDSNPPAPTTQPGPRY